ncbi:protein kinase [bacterium]
MQYMEDQRNKAIYSKLLQVILLKIQSGSIKGFKKFSTIKQVSTFVDSEINREITGNSSKDSVAYKIVTAAELFDVYFVVVDKNEKLIFASGDEETAQAAIIFQEGVVSNTFKYIPRNAASKKKKVSKKSRKLYEQANRILSNVREQQQDVDIERHKDSISKDSIMTDPNAPALLSEYLENLPAEEPSNPEIKLDSDGNLEQSKSDSLLSQVSTLAKKAWEVFRYLLASDDPDQANRILQEQEAEANQNLRNLINEKMEQPHNDANLMPITITQAGRHFYYIQDDKYVVGDCGLYALARAMLDQDGKDINMDGEFDERIINEMRNVLAVLASRDEYLSVNGHVFLYTGSLIKLARKLGYVLTVIDTKADQDLVVQAVENVNNLNPENSLEPDLIANLSNEKKAALLKSMNAVEIQQQEEALASYSSQVQEQPITNAIKGRINGYDEQDVTYKQILDAAKQPVVLQAPAEDPENKGTLDSQLDTLSDSDDDFDEDDQLENAGIFKAEISDKDKKLKKYLDEKSSETVCTIGKKIASGSYGSVYEAEVHGDSNYVIKKMTLDTDDGVELGHIIDEINFMKAQKMNPYAAEIMGAYYVEDEDEGKFDIYILMPKYLTLQQVIEHYRNKNIPVEELLFKCLIGLKDMHAQGIFHRDIKPENLLFQELGQSVIPKYIDFGVSAEKDEDIVQAFLGTPKTLDMELVRANPLRGREVTEILPKADLWSLGITISFFLNQLGITKLSPPEIFQEGVFIIDAENNDKKKEFEENLAENRKKFELEIENEQRKNSNKTSNKILAKKLETNVQYIKSLSKEELDAVIERFVFRDTAVEFRLKYPELVSIDKSELERKVAEFTKSIGPENIRHMISQLLVVDYEQRPTAEQALKQLTQKPMERSFSNGTDLNSNSDSNSNSNSDSDSDSEIDSRKNSLSVISEASFFSGSGRRSLSMTDEILYNKLLKKWEKFIKSFFNLKSNDPDQLAVRKNVLGICLSNFVLKKIKEIFEYRKVDFRNKKITDEENKKNEITWNSMFDNLEKEVKFKEAFGFVQTQISRQEFGFVLFQDSAEITFQDLEKLEVIRRLADKNLDQCRTAFFTFANSDQASNKILTKMLNSIFPEFGLNALHDRTLEVIQVGAKPTLKLGSIEENPNNTKTTEKYYERVNMTLRHLKFVKKTLEVNHLKAWSIVGSIFGFTAMGVFVLGAVFTSFTLFYVLAAISGIVLLASLVSLGVTVYKNRIKSMPFAMRNKKFLERYSRKIKKPKKVKKKKSYKGKQYHQYIELGTDPEEELQVPKGLVPQIADDYIMAQIFDNDEEAVQLRKKILAGEIAAGYSDNDTYWSGAGYVSEKVLEAVRSQKGRKKIKHATTDDAAEVMNSVFRNIVDIKQALGENITKDELRQFLIPLRNKQDFENRKRKLIAIVEKRCDEVVRQLMMFKDKNGQTYSEKIVKNLSFGWMIYGNTGILGTVKNKKCYEKMKRKFRQQALGMGVRKYKEPRLPRIAETTLLRNIKPGDLTKPVSQRRMWNALTVVYEQYNNMNETHKTLGEILDLFPEARMEYVRAISQDIGKIEIPVDLKYVSNKYDICQEMTSTLDLLCEMNLGLTREELKKRVRLVLLGNAAITLDRSNLTSLVNRNTIHVAGTYILDRIFENDEDAKKLRQLVSTGKVVAVHSSMIEELWTGTGYVSQEVLETVKKIEKKQKVEDVTDEDAANNLNNMLKFIGMFIEHSKFYRQEIERFLGPIKGDKDFRARAKLLRVLLIRKGVSATEFSKSMNGLAIEDMVKMLSMGWMIYGKKGIKKTTKDAKEYKKMRAKFKQQAFGMQTVTIGKSKNAIIVGQERQPLLDGQNQQVSVSIPDAYVQGPCGAVFSTTAKDDVSMTIKSHQQLGSNVYSFNQLSRIRTELGLAKLIELFAVNGLRYDIIFNMFRCNEKRKLITKKFLAIASAA